MAFVLLLLLSITTLTQVETRQADQQKSLTQARQNATAAAMMAIGRLQQTTGPDQRVTAQAEILSYDNGGAAAKAPHFTGVWATDPNYLATNNDPAGNSYISSVDDPQLKPATIKNVRQPIKWLVSEMDDTANAPSSAAQMVAYPWNFTAPTGADAVVMFDSKDPSSNSEAEDIVLTRQPFDRSSASNTGHYAWWVSDEGVKASLQLDRDANSKNNLTNINVLAPPTQGIGNASFDSNNTRIIDQVSNYQDFQDDLIKAADYDHIQLIAEGSGLNASSTSEEDKISRARFHDFTILSRGVLANVRDGGLKRDLSAAFADDTEFDKLAGPGSHTDDQLQARSDRYHSGSNPYSGSSAEYQIFPWPRGTTSTSSGNNIDMLNPGGPMWEQLRSFYQLTESELDIDWDDNGSDDLKIEVTKAANGSLSINQPVPSTTYTSGIHPVISHYQQFYHPYFYQADPDTSAIGASLLVIPTVVIWNPSNVTIEPTDLYFMIYKRLSNSPNNVGDFESTQIKHNYFAPYMAVNPTPSTAAEMPFGLNYKNIQRVEDFKSSPDNQAPFPDTEYGFRYILKLDTPLLPGQARIFSPDISQASSQPGNSMQMDRNFLGGNPAKGYLLHEGYRPGDYFYINHAQTYTLNGATIEELGMFKGGNKNYHSAILGGTNYIQTFKRPYSIIAGLGLDNTSSNFRANNVTYTKRQTIAFKTSELGVDPTQIPFNSSSITTIPTIHPAVFVHNTVPYYPVHGIVNYPRLPAGYVTSGSGASTKNMANTNPASRMGGNNGLLRSMSDEAGVTIGKSIDNTNRYNAAINTDDLNQNAGRGYLSLDGSNDTFDESLINIPMGYSDNLSSGEEEDRWIAYDLPANDSYIQNIGHLSEARLTRPSRSQRNRTSLDYDDIFEYGSYATGFSYLSEASEPTHPIGNSYSPLHLKIDSRVRDLARVNDITGKVEGDGNIILYDTSYELNDALWDSYFFSTYPASSIGSTPAAADLRHPRLETVEDAQITATGLHESAGHLMTTGAFNVNSTSIPAWEAVLASALGQNISTNSGTDNHGDDKIPFPAQTQPYGSGLSLSGANLTRDAETYEGYPVLSDTQITALATELVDQVKKRGPFLSMSHFVNRVIQNNDHRSTAEAKNLQDDVLNGRVEALLGPLQSAIDQSDVNSGYKDETVTNTNRLDLYDPSVIGNDLEMRNAYGPVASGSSGYLTQDKILKQLGSTLQVRSDTFKIRAYGDTVDPVSGSTTARAWCEVVVQRRPEYINKIDAPQDLVHTGDSNLLVQQAINQTHGRRYEIVSWRWLSENGL